MLCQSITLVIAGSSTLPDLDPPYTRAGGGPSGGGKPRQAVIVLEGAYGLDDEPGSDRADTRGRV